jgi:phosphatidyl-myo-inositol dimannoside synthase
VRALVLTPDFPPGRGGIQTLVQRVVGGWRALDALVVTAGPAVGDNETCGVARVRRVEAFAALGHRAAMLGLNGAGFLAGLRARPRVVLSLHVVVGPAAWAVSRVLSVPFVQYVHAREVVHRPRLARFVLRRAAAVIVVSRYAQSLALDCGAEPGRIRLIPPGVDPPASRSGRRNGRPTVLTIARLEHEYKGHDVTLRAIARVRERVPDVLWVAIGDGPLRARYEDAAQALGLGESVRFLGSVDDSERDAWLDRAHAFAMPSRVPPEGGGEGFGIVYLEAAAHGLPAIAGNAGGALDAVVDGQTGLLVDPRDEQAVADAIAGLLLDPEHAQELGLAAAARAHQFTWARAAGAVEDLLKEVATR